MSRIVKICFLDYFLYFSTPNLPHALSAFSLAAGGAKKKLTKRNAMGVSPFATGDKGYAPLTAPPFKERKQTRKRDLREFASQTVADENF